MQVDEPKAEAVDPSNDAILSPVKIDGEAKGEPVSLDRPPISSIDEPQQPETKIEDAPMPVSTGLGDIAMGEAAAAAPKAEEVVSLAAQPLAEEATPVAAQQSAEQSTVQAEKPVLVAPAVGGLGGASGPSAIPGAIASAEVAGQTRPADGLDGGQEPPAKRQRQSTSADPSKQPLAGPDATQMTAAQIKFCQNIIKSLKGRPDSLAFVAPVNPEQLGIPHYRTIIKEPMDLGTVDIKLALTAAASKGGQKHTDKTKQADKWNLDPVKDVYATIDDFEKDVRLVFQNCFTFNGPDHPLSLSAQNLQNVFDKQLKTMPSSNPPAPGAAVENSSSVPPTPGDASSIAGGRRASDGLASRPKRDIHPPAPKDLPWADQPQAAGATGSKKKKSKKPLTPRQQAYVNKKNKDQLRYCAKVIDLMYKPPAADYAWPFFAKPEMGLDFAEAYYQEIKRPIALKDIKNAITINQYEDAEDVQSDMELLFANCFQFNPPGTDVYVMGDKLKSFWNDKLKKMPQPPEPAEDEEEEEEEEEEEDESQIQARAIRDQIELLQMQLQGLEGNNKAAGAKALASAKASLAALPAKKGQRRPSESGGSAKKKAAGGAGGGTSGGGGGGAAKKSKASTSSSAGAGGDGAAKKATSKPKKPSGGKKRDEDVRDVTYEQKEELATKITQLSDEALEIALKIIAEDKPPSANDDEEIELDIDDLSPGTLYKLYRHVVRPKGPKKPVADKSNAIDGRKRGTGGVKRKNLDEGEEAARIARLQAQLQQFDNPDAGECHLVCLCLLCSVADTHFFSAQGSGAPTAGAHDDLVASDSSSGEDESDSESEYE